MELNAFEKACARLNHFQKQAVEALDGPVMVLAGPGTGKTQVLACRIAHILATQDVEPSSILALTFTDAAAKNMRERVVSLVGSVGYSVTITTFHSFCREVIDSYPEYIPVERGSQPLSDLERYSLFEQLLTDTQLTALKPLNKTLHYLPDVISSISQLKRENFFPEKFEAVIAAEEQQFEQERDELKKSEVSKREKALQKQKELLTLYTKYQQELVKKSRYDFDDMIAFVLQGFETIPDLLLSYQEKLQYVLVDEFQDTNASQNKVIDLLMSYWAESANIFVVGDPHQSIFRFQGASLENTLGFLERYPTATIITLEAAYRCPQPIYTAAHDLIANNSLAIKGLAQDTEGYKLVEQAVTAQLSSQNNTEGEIQVYAAPTLEHEVEFVVSKIKSLVNEGISLENIAVLYRNHSDCIELLDALGTNELPCRTDMGGAILEDISVLQLLDLCTLIDSLKGTFDNELFFKVLLFKWIGADRATVFSLQHAAGSQKSTIFTLLKDDTESLATQLSVSVESIIEIKKISEKLAFWHAENNNVLFHEWFSRLIDGAEENGFPFFTWFAASDVDKHHVLAIQSLFSEIKQWVSSDRSFNLTTFLHVLTVIRKNNLAFKVKQLQRGKKAATVTSVHKAKGQEWEYVFIIRVRDGKWGNARKNVPIPLPASLLQFVDIDKVEKNEDDRRLFYVALTRAKKSVFVSYPQSRTIGGSTTVFVQSMFLTEIERHFTLIAAEVSDEIEQSLAKNVLQIPTVAKGGGSSLAEKDFFSALLLDFKLSVTALNAYLQDPKQFVLQSLLKVPKVKEGYLSYGTAMHAGLEAWYKKIGSDGRSPDVSIAKNAFTSALQKELISQSQMIRFQDKGSAILDQYVLKNPQPQRPVATEFNFGSSSRPIVLGDADAPITLGGRVDRIDLLAENQRSVRVVDYKTGAVKTKNDIEGLTKAGQALFSPRELTLPECIRSGYKRQLVFYKLLAQLDRSFPYTVDEVAFEFLEPKETTGDFVTQRFVITYEEVEALKQLIIEVMTEIRDLSFLDTIEWD